MLFHLKYIPLISLDLAVQKTALSKGFKNPSVYKKKHLSTLANEAKDTNTKAFFEISRSAFSRRQRLRVWTLQPRQVSMCCYLKNLVWIIGCHSWPRRSSPELAPPPEAPCPLILCIRKSKLQHSGRVLYFVHGSGGTIKCVCLFF